MLDESAESAAWSCLCFSDCFRVPPAVIFSDCAPALKAAVESVFPTSQHLYCVWHLSKNMVTHLKPACGANDDLWCRVRTKWWQIVKNSEESSRTDFAAEWAALGAMLDESTAASASKEAARTWLAKSGAEREHWAYRFTWRFVTMGLHSTQRIEAVHSAVEHFLRANTLLTELVPRLESYSVDVSVRAAVREHKFIERLLTAASQCLPHPFINALAQELTAYALVLFKVQLQQAQFYSAVALPETEGAFTVTRRAGSWGVEGDEKAQGRDAELGISAPLFTKPRRTTLTVCSCQFPVCYGLPCRHMLILHILLQREVCLALFDSRWKQRSPEAEQAAEQSLLLRRPLRAPPGPAMLPDRDERYALIMAAARGVAQVGAETAGGYTVAVEGLGQLLSRLRQPNAGSVAMRRQRAAPGAAFDAALTGVEGAATAATGPTCRSCWGKLPFPHNKNNRRCPNFGKEPLPDPRALALAPARTVRHGLADLVSASSDEEAESSDMEDGNSNVCHACSEPGELLACDSCVLSWHQDCVPLAARPLLHVEPWECPVCAGNPIPTSFICNPKRALPGRGGGQARKRFRSATEGTKSQRKHAKQAARRHELRFRG
jgi:hypothetical protein